MSLISGDIGSMVRQLRPGDVTTEPEVNVMIILLTLAAIVIAGVPVAAVVLVSVATRREESARSIADRAPGLVARAARRLLAFQAVGISRPASRIEARRPARRADYPPEDGPAPADDLELVGSGRR
jgi:hypothetical protein